MLLVNDIERLFFSLLLFLNGHISDVSGGGGVKVVNHMKVMPSLFLCNKQGLNDFTSLSISQLSSCMCLTLAGCGY